MSLEPKASEEGLEDLPDEEIYALRTRLKMDMLRDHMKEYLSKDFVASLPRERRDVKPKADEGTIEVEGENEADHSKP
ncbi:hypothetical protein ACEWPM_014845 [Roseovarius sp. S4756]|uniref:hypothetical protein n=1 Tax=Roseovarius maritimus TaxID=3342637 RepID=UPI00372AA4F0